MDNNDLETSSLTGEEANARFQEVMGDVHVSQVEGIATGLVASHGGAGELGIIISFVSCCGLTAYNMSLEEAKSFVDSINNCMAKVPEAKEMQNAIRN